MAKSKQRYISTSFWDDVWVQTLDPSEKFVYLYLLTNPVTNIAGVYEIALRRIQFDTGYNNETIERILGRFERDKKAYYVDGYIILPNAPKHQNWKTSEDTKAGVDRILNELPASVLLALHEVGYEYPDMPEAPHRPPIGPHEAPRHTILNSTLPNLTVTAENTVLILGELENVKLKQRQYDKLVSDYGGDIANTYIRKVSLWKPNAPRKVKDDYSTILTFLDKDSIKKVPPILKCPHCGTTLSDGVCPNRDCPQYTQGELAACAEGG